VSPRSSEFLDAARRRLRAAKGAVTVDPSAALSAGYYAMLYAARAALSERDAYAKTHAGTWHLFREQFVSTGSFDGDLLSGAQNLQREREDADYEAWLTPVEEADRVIELASSFIAAVEELIDQLSQE
jgi:uncharacterized protein (UPF0332 family)